MVHAHTCDVRKDQFCSSNMFSIAQLSMALVSFIQKESSLIIFNKSVILLETCQKPKKQKVEYIY